MTGKAVETIADFDPAGGDIIDLSRIDAGHDIPGDQAFLSGGTRFSGRSAELIQHAGAGGWWIEADAQGDGIADFRIVLAGVTAPLPAESILL